MNVLAIETSTDACSVALRTGSTVLERHEIAPRRHGELLLRFVDALMAEAGLRPNQLTGLVLGRGPGSFTGLRLGAGVVQGIAYGAEVPVACVSSLATLARGAAAPRVYCVQDARMGEVYAGGFEAGGTRVTVRERVAPPDALEPPPGAGWVGVGTGFAIAADALARRLGAALAHVDSEHRYPRAGDALALGVPMLEAGRGVEAARALPVYLRDEVTRPT